MTGLRVIPVSPLGHSADCRICAAVDNWAANRKRRPTGKQLASMPDADFAAFIEDSGIETSSSPRRSGVALTDPSVPPGQASAEVGVTPDLREHVNGTSASR